MNNSPVTLFLFLTIQPWLPGIIGF